MSTYRIVPDEPMGSDDLARGSQAEELDPMAKGFLDSLSDEEVGKFVRMRDELTEKLQKENPLLSANDLNKLVGEQIKPLVAKWLEENG